MQDSIDRSRCYPLLVDALRLLPDIRPVSERHQLGMAKHLASLSSSRTANVGGVTVTLAQLEQLFLYSERGGPRISPAGAKLLLHLFGEGAFEATECRKVEGGLEQLTQYSNGLASVLDYSFWRRARRRGESHVARSQKNKSSGHPDRVSISSYRTPGAIVHRLI